jgi:hypothetical protein
MSDRLREEIEIIKKTQSEARCIHIETNKQCHSDSGPLVQIAGAREMQFEDILDFVRDLTYGDVNNNSSHPFKDVRCDAI